MKVLDSFELGDVISFQVYPDNYYGDIFKNLRAADILSADTAAFYKFNAGAEHAKVYNTLPEGTPNDPFGYKYLLLTPPDPKAAKIVVGLPWIRKETIVVSQRQNAYIIIPDVSVMDDTRKLQELLASGGYRGFTIEFK